MKVNTAIKNGTIQTLCRQCGVRCGVKVHIRDGAIVDFSGLDEHPANRGPICVKGRVAKELFYHEDRLLKPLKKKRDGSFREISRERALDEIAEKILHIRQEYGARSMGVWKGEAIGYYQEEDYARRFIHAFGSPNYMSNDSACFNGRYLGFLLVHGFWNSHPEFEHADLNILWGTNLSVSHPTFMREVAEAQKRGAKLIVIDPRLNKTTKRADIVARPRPGTDGALAWGLSRQMIEANACDQKFIEKYSVGFEAFARYAEKFTPEFVQQQTGVDRHTIHAMADMIADSLPKVVIFPGIGLEHQQNGVNDVRTIACLATLCGALDIRGGFTWPEAMGERKLSLCDEISLRDQKPIGADRFPVLYDYRWECHTMTAMNYMLGQGEYPLKGIIMTAANPVINNPNSSKVAKALSSLDLLVVNDLFLTETAKLAHYVFPAATFLERSELHFYPKYHLVALTRKVAEISGVHDEYSLWHDLAHRLGFGLEYFPWENEEQVNRWILEPTGISLEELQNHPEGIVYRPLRYKKFEARPFPTRSGKVEFTSPYLKELNLSEISEYIPPRYLRHPQNDFPLVLNTGARHPLYYHSRYHNIPKFLKAFQAAQVEMNPADAERLGVENTERVRVISEIGSVEVRAKIVDAAQLLPGFVEIPHGWQDGNVNLVTFDNINDPISGFPLLKAVPVRIEKVLNKKGNVHEA
ncbi:MAG: molybdopterin-dependent oxidoreductase [Desulfobacteraceae bacterium]|nr:MAG: molybdopterin-dependent oxidoreductase [Desulfobacteraceae bacterium]